MKYILVDGNNLLSRVYSVQNTNLELATESIINYLISYMSLDDERYIYVADGGRNKKRMSIFPEYKEQRKIRFNESYSDSFSKEKLENNIRKILPSMGWQFIKYDGQEADDIIANIIKFLDKQNENNEYVIVSEDDDFTQLLKDNVKTYKPRKQILFTIDDFIKKYEYHPSLYFRQKALQGDTSDNIPNCYKGLGPKKAQKIVKQISTSEDENAPPSIYDKKINNGTYFRNCSIINLRDNLSDIEVFEIDDTSKIFNLSYFLKEIKQCSLKIPNTKLFFMINKNMSILNRGKNEQ